MSTKEMNSIDCRLILSGFVSLMALILAGPAYAACTMPDSAPDAQAGDVVFNVDHDTLQFCDGANWISMGGGGLWTANGNDIYYDDGNVGIGTDSPGYILHALSETAGDVVNLDNFTSSGLGGGYSVRTARGTAASPATVQDDDRLGAIFFQGYDGSAYSSGVATIFGEVDGVPGAGDMPARLTFHTTPDGSVLRAERMRITSGGNVGIGTTDPLYKLHVSGLGIMALFDGTDSDVRVDIKNDARRYGIKVRDLGTGDDTFFITDETAGAERMSLSPEGDVGIGVSDPQHKLHVAGNIHATGDITCDGDCGGTGSETLSCAGGTNPQVYNGRCYTHFTARDAYWPEARSVCQAWGGDLLIVNDAGEQSFISTNYTESGSWIGIADNAAYASGAAEGAPRWVDGTAPAYTNWNASTNQHNNRDCVIMNADGTWRYEACDNNVFPSGSNRNFFCEASVGYSSVAAQSTCPTEQILANEYVFGGDPPCDTEVYDKQCINGVVMTVMRSGGACPSY